MSWYPKLCLFVIPLFYSINLHAQRIEFYRSASQKATVEHRLLEQKGMVQSLDIKLSVPSIDLERNSDGFQTVKVEGLVPQSIPGNPEVGLTGQLIAVPDGYEANLSLLSQQQQDINDVVVQPTQRQFRCGGHLDGFSYNTALYESNSLFPAQVARLEEVGRLQGLKLMRVALNPIQMDFAKRSMRVTTQLNARVTFRKVSDATPVLLPSTFLRIAKAVAANGRGLGNTVRASRAPETLVIIAADSLKADLLPLIQWKQQKGLNVQVFTLAQAGKTKEEIKTFLQKYYDAQATKPTYLLMVGNKDTMPTFMETAGGQSAASDWRYTLLSGNDNIPDVFYGRLVADNATELKVQISRWIDYEKTPEAGAAWFHDGMTIASNEGSNPSDKEYAQQIQEALRKGTYKEMDSFFAGDQNATAKNITEALQKGRSWIAYFGHGSGTSWGSTNDAFGNTQVAKLTNTNRLPVLIDVACANASWVKLAKCFGKAWVTQVSNGKNAGAVGFYGGSVNISWHPPAVMSVGVAKYHFEKALSSLGATVLAGQLYLIEKMGTGNDTLDNMKWYNLLGDPSLTIRTDTPKEVQVKHELIKKNDDVSLTVAATDKEGNGLAGLTVAITLNARDPLAVGKTDASGNAELSLAGIGALEPGTQLTVTGYNVETVQSDISQ